MPQLNATRAITTILTFLFGGVVGYWLHGDNPPEAPPSGPARAVNVPNPASSPNTGNGKDSSPRPRGTLDDLREPLSAKVKRYASGLNVSEIKAAMASLGKVDSTDRTVASELLRAWAKLEPEAAWTYAKGLSSPSERLNAQRAVAGELAKSQPLIALDKALSLSDPSHRNLVFSNVLSDWMKTDPRTAAKYWNEHPELPDISLELGVLMLNLSYSQPALAAELALSLRSSKSLDMGFTDPLSPPLQSWTARDPNSALAWARSLRDLAQRDRALASVARALMTNDARQGFALVAEQRDSSLAEQLYGEWLSKSPRQASDYLSGLAPAEAKHLAKRIGLPLTKLDTAEQKRFVSVMPEGEAKSILMQTVVKHQGSLGRYTQALDILNTMQDSEGRDRSVHVLATAWSKKDAAAVDRWIQQQPDSSDRDFIICGHCSQVALTDPAAALRLASLIPDPRIRRGAEKNVFIMWSSKDAQGALQWLNTRSGLSAAARLELQQEYETEFAKYSRSPLLSDYLPIPLVTSYR
jgi:hypothetical protein